MVQCSKFSHERILCLCLDKAASDSRLFAYTSNSNSSMRSCWIFVGVGRSYKPGARFKPSSPSCHYSCGASVLVGFTHHWGSCNSA